MKSVEESEDHRCGYKAKDGWESLQSDRKSPARCSEPSGGASLPAEVESTHRAQESDRVESLPAAETMKAPTSGAANATNVTLVKTPRAIVPPKAALQPTGSRWSAPTILRRRRMAKAKRSVSRELEKGRRRKVKVIGAVAKRKSGVLDSQLSETIQSGTKSVRCGRGGAGSSLPTTRLSPHMHSLCTKNNVRAEGASAKAP